MSYTQKNIIPDQPPTSSSKDEVLCIHQCIHESSLDGYSTFFESRGKGLPFVTPVKFINKMLVGGQCRPPYT
jgi:hypothetical protein